MMKDYGRVSIITPNWNCGRYIAKTIQSVLAQSYPYWEMIVVDDCSADNSVEVVKAYAANDGRIRLLQNEINIGAAESRNRALREATGHWVAFLDADDLWHAHKLEQQLRFMTANGYNASYTQYTAIDDRDNDMGLLLSGPRHINLCGMYCYCWMGCLTVMYNRQEVGLLQIEPIKVNNDYAMWLKLCRKTDIYLLPKTLAQYRMGRGNSVSNRSVVELMGWHYRLFRHVDGKNIMSALALVVINMLCGVYKKMFYTKRKV